MADPIAEISVQITGDYSDLSPALETAVEQAQSGADQIADAFDGLDDVASPLEDSLSSAGTAADAAGEQLAAVSQQAQHSGEAASESAAGWSELGDQLLKIVSIAGVGLGLKEIALEAVRSFGAAQDLTISLGVLSGSSEAAEKTMDSLRDTATRFAVPLESLVATTQRLAPAMLSAGVSLDDIDNAMAVIAATARVTGRDVEGVGQSVERMTLSTQLGQRQLATLGITLDQLAAQLNVTAADLRGPGNVWTALEPGARLAALTGALEHYESAAELMAGDVRGQMTNLANVWHTSLENMGESLAPVAGGMAAFASGVVGSIGSIVGAFNELASNPQFAALEKLAGRENLEFQKWFSGMLSGAKTADQAAEALVKINQAADAGAISVRQAAVATDALAAAQQKIANSELKSAFDALGVSVHIVSSGMSLGAATAQATAVAHQALVTALKQAQDNLISVTTAFNLHKASADAVATALAGVAKASEELSGKHEKLSVDTKKVSEALYSVASVGQIAAAEENAAALGATALGRDVDLAGQALARTNAEYLAGTKTLADLVKAQASLRAAQDALGASQQQSQAAAFALAAGYQRAALGAGALHDAMARADAEGIAEGLALRAAQKAYDDSVLTLQGVTKAYNQAIAAGKATPAMAAAVVTALHDQTVAAEALKSAWDAMTAGAPTVPVAALGVVLPPTTKAIMDMVLASDELAHSGAALPPVFKDDIDAAKKLQEQFEKTFSKDVSSALSGIAMGSETAGKAFTKMGQDLLKAIITSGIEHLLSSLTGANSGIGGIFGGLTKALSGGGGAGAAAGGTAAQAANTAALHTLTSAVMPATQTIGTLDTTVSGLSTATQTAGSATEAASSATQTLSAGQSVLNTSTVTQQGMVTANTTALQALTTAVLANTAALRSSSLSGGGGGGSAGGGGGGGGFGDFLGSLLGLAMAVPMGETGGSVIDSGLMYIHAGETIQPATLAPLGSSPGSSSAGAGPYLDFRGSTFHGVTQDTITTLANAIVKQTRRVGAKW